MDRHLVLVFASVILTVCNAHNPVVNPLQNVVNDESEELDNVPYYPDMSEENEQYFNPSLYAPPAYGYRNIVPHPSRRTYGNSYGSAYPHPMYMPPGLSNKWGAPYQPQYPTPLAYWLSKYNNKKHLPKQHEVPLEQTTTVKTPNEITTSAATTSSTTTSTTTSTTSAPTTTTTTTTEAPEPTTEAITEIVVIETTETPKQKAEEAAEEPKQRQLPMKTSEKNCAPDEKPTEQATIANEENPTTAIPEEKPAAAISGATEPVAIPQVTSENVPAPSTEVAVPSIEATSSEEEVAPMATLRFNNIPVHPEMALPPMYPRKSLYGPPYPPMPYLPAIPMDPYAAYHPMNRRQMYPGISRRFYGY